MDLCDEVRDRLMDFIDGELAADECRRIEAHLDRCPQCAHEIVGLREVLERARALPAPMASADFLDGFAAAVLKRVADARPFPLPVWRRVAAWLGSFASLRPVPALSAAAVLGILLSIGLVRTPRPPQRSAASELLVLGESLSVAQNLDVLEQFDLLEDLDLLEQLPLLRSPEGDRPTGLS